MEDNYCEHRNPHSRERCQRPENHDGKHRTYDGGHVLTEWGDEPAPMWTPPKPEPVFTAAELAELYLLLSEHGTAGGLLSKVTTLLKESL